MKLNLSILLGLCLMLFAACSEDNVPQPDQADAFLKFYGGNFDDQACNDVLALDDGGFLLLGKSNSFSGEGNEDWYLIRTDAGGNELWSNTFDNVGLNDEGVKLLTLSDGYLLGGNVLTTDSLQKIMILKTDFDGNESWRSILKEADNSEESFSDFAPAIEGETGYVVVGTTSDVDITKNDYDPETDLLDIYTARIEATGSLRWDVADGFGDLDFGASIEVVGSDYLVMGDAFVTSINTRNLLLINYNTDGIIIDRTDFGDGLTLKANDTQILNDGRFLVLGTIETTNQVIISIPTIEPALAEGTIITIGTVEQVSGTSVVENTDGTLVISATSTSGDNKNIILMEVDLLGGINWQQTYGNPSSGEDEAGTVKLHQTSGYVVAGKFDISTNLMGGLLRVNSNGELVPE